MKLKEMVKVRFNLSSGKNYMKWKIEYPDGTKEYLSPSECQLIMYNALLKNYKTVAEKIFNGGEKVVCAWIMCESIEIIREHPFTLINEGEINRLSYNPRITPNWVCNGCDVDGFEFNKVISINNKLYVI
jgi:hypothetical protein